MSTSLREAEALVGCTGSHPPPPAPGQAGSVAAAGEPWGSPASAWAGQA